MQQQPIGGHKGDTIYLGSIPQFQRERKNDGETWRV